MAVDLRGIYAKLERAEFHLTELDRVLGPVFNVRSEHFIRVTDSTGTKLVYWTTSVPPIDLGWSIIIGDVLTNLRAALDHLAWQLVLLDGDTPTRETYFPILEIELNRNGSTVKPSIGPGSRSPGIQAAIEQAQPYQRGEGVAAEQHQLWGLNELVKIDKHRLLLTMEQVVDSHNAWWGLEGKTNSPIVEIYDMAIGDDQAVASFDFQGSTAPEEFDPHLALTVRLDEGPPMNRMRSMPARQFLQDIATYIDWMMRAHFLPLFDLNTPGYPFDAGGTPSR